MDWGAHRSIGPVRLGWKVPGNLGHFGGRHAHYKFTTAASPSAFGYGNRCAHRSYGRRAGRMQGRKEASAAVPDRRMAGAAPTGPLESDPWVQATRDFLEAEAVARNINDFSIPELVRTAGRDMRSRAARPAFDDVKQRRRPDILPGPTPFLPLSVTPNFRGDPDRAAVRGAEQLRGLRKREKCLPS